MRISDWSSDVCSSDLMALHAVDMDPHVDRSAPADLDDVAQPPRGGWLAHHAEVRTQAVRGPPLHQGQRAMDGRAFLIAGDDQADRAGQVFGQEIGRANV